MPDVTVELEKRTGVEQFLEAFAGEQLSLLALAFDRALAAGVPRLLSQLGQPAQLRPGRISFRRHDASVSPPGRG